MSSFEDNLRQTIEIVEETFERKTNERGIWYKAPSFDAVIISASLNWLQEQVAELNKNLKEINKGQ